jgi:hypothetical protein
MFGVFAAAVGIGLPILKTGGMDYLMVRLQVGKELEGPHLLWAYQTLETIYWTMCLGVLSAAVMGVEQWVRNNNERDLDDELEEVKTTSPKTDKKEKSDYVLRGICGIIITVVVSIILLAFLTADQSKGQVAFAVIASFLVAAMTAEQIAESRHPVWQLAAVPIVALFAYGYTWFHPDRPGFETLLHIAPNNLARVLPIEYIFFGTVGSIFGTWTSHRLRHSKEHE